MKLAVNNPNLSLIMPVGCNANCDFCYWEKGEGLTLERFKFICDTLPEVFQQISITGGEPTLYPDLEKHLEIARKRFKKVVLNSNGFNIGMIDLKNIDHLNISRHHWCDSDNEDVFRCFGLPSTYHLRAISKNVDTTLNCVLPDGFSDHEFISKYIDFAKWCGAKVAFRKYFSNLDVLPVDKDDTLINQHSCPACLHRYHRIDDVDVTFKYGVKETFEKVDGIYELIIQPNGDLTFDWDGNKKLKFKEI